jgi:hypothetical protein
MNQYYDDIIQKCGEPIWFDECAVPRYCKFEPTRLANIYARECCLLEIACQDCGHKFLVAMSWSNWDKIHGFERFSEEIKRIHYGDPPNIGCCLAGPTMNCEDLRVVEFWKEEDFEWVRVPELEINLEDGGKS